MCLVSFCVNRQAKRLRVGAGEQHRGASVLAGVTPRVFPRLARHRDTTRRFPGGRFTVSPVHFFIALHETRAVSTATLLPPAAVFFSRKDATRGIVYYTHFRELKTKLAPSFSCDFTRRRFIRRASCPISIPLPPIRSREIVEIGKCEREFTDTRFVNSLVSLVFITDSSRRPNEARSLVANFKSRPSETR